MIFYKTKIGNIYSNKEDLYRIINGEPVKIDVIDLINESNFQLACELEDADLKHRVSDLFKKIVMALCLVFSFNVSGQTIERFCVEPKDLMVECRERCSYWFEMNYGDRYNSANSSVKAKLDLIKRTAPVAVYLYLKDGGVLPSVKIAMAGLESSWGKSFSSRKRNNYFNVKSYKCMKHGCKHKVPCTNINDDTPNDMYRGYSSLFVSFVEHDRFLQKPRYCAIEKMTSAYEQIRQIKKGGYATDPSYAKKLVRIASEIVSLDDVAHQLEHELKIEILDIICE